MAYKDLEALAPDDQLKVLFAENGFEGVDCWVQKGLERVWRYVEEGCDDCVLQSDCVLFFAAGILAEVDDVCVAGRTA